MAIIIDNFDLFKYNTQTLQDKTEDIANKCLNNNYNPSDKQKYFLNKAYESIHERVQKRKRQKEEFDAMASMDQLWEKYSHNEFDEESSPYKALNYKYFTIIYQEMQQRIEELENELYEERMGADL